MKKLSVITVVALFVVGCHFGGLGTGVKGSGVRKTEQRTVNPFSSMTTEGAFEIVVVCQKPQTFEISGDDNLLPLVGADVSGGVLHIKNTQNYSAHEPITIKISVPDIAFVRVDGAGTMEISALKNDNLKIKSNGAPTIRVAGETKLLEISANGAGKIDAHKLRATSATVEANGVPGIEVFASDDLNVNVSGPARILYHGDPKVTKTINGPGSVEKKESAGS